MVERFRREHFEMRPYEEGLWVRHSDYAALEAQLAEAIAENHDLIEKWDLAVRATQEVIAQRDTALEATPPAPKVSDEMVERGAKKLLLVMPELLRLYPSTAGEVARRDVREVLDAALTEAQEAGKP